MSFTELSDHMTGSFDVSPDGSANSPQNIYNLFNEVPFAVAVLTGHRLTIDYINKYNLEIWQQKKEDVIGKPLFDVRPDLRDSAEKIHQEAYKTGKRLTVREIPVEIIMNGESETRYFDTVIDPMFDSNGLMTGQLVTSIEVTDKVLARKKIEESEALLRKTKEQLELSIEAGKIGVWHWDVRKKQMTWSREQFEIFGVSQEDFKGDANDFFRHVIEEDREKIRIASGLEYRRSENQYEFRIRRRDGEIRWIQSRSKTFMDGNGEPQYITGINIDVTEQVIGQNLIEESRQQLQLITDALPVLISYVNKKEEYQFNNKGYEQWFGYSLASVKGRTIREVVGEPAYKKIEPFIRKVLSGELVSYESWVPYKDGGLRFVAGTYIPHKNEAGEVIGFYALISDVTERRQIEEKVKNSEEKNRLFIEYAPAAMAMFDKEMRYVSVSKRWMDEYDLTGDIIGKKHYELFPNILQRWKEVHARCMSGTVERSDEDFFVKDDGTPVWLKWEVYPWYMATNEVGGIVIFTENITEQKKAQLAVKENEERFRAMANEAPLFVWETDENLQTTYLNKSGLDYFNLDPSIKMGELSWKKYIHPDEIEEVLGIMWDAVSKHQPYTLEMRLKDGRTGEYHWFLDNGTPRYVNQEFIGFIGTSLDIHDRKMLQKELEEKVKQRTDELYRANLQLLNQNRFVETVINSSQEWIAVWDKDLRLTLINDAGLAGIGKTKDDVIGKTLLEILPSAKDTHTETDLKRALTGEYIQNEPFYSLVGKWVKNYVIPMKDEKGNVYAAFAVAYDVTPIIESQHALQKSQKHFASLFNVSPVAKIITGEGDGKIIDVNPAWERLFKKKRTEVVGKTTVEIGLVSEQARTQKLKEFADRGGVISDSEIQMQVDGENVYMLLSIVSIELDGVKCYLGAVIDITERKKEEQQRKQFVRELALKNKELESTIQLLRTHELMDEQKNNFIAMASHELKTPITSIKGYVQLLLNAAGKEKELQKPLPPLLVRSSLISVDKQIKRLTRLISELLDISKIETGTLELKRERFSLNELAIETVEDILYTNARHQINLHHDFRSYVFGDKDRIGQVMINFLTNAIKYSPDTDRIDITIYKASNNEIAFSVKDYGIGIDKGEQTRVFDRFYRAKGKEEQTYPGFGIGLFIAKEFIQKHGGKLRLDSEKGKGSTFTFILPINEADL